MKLVSLLVAFCFSLNVMASTGSVQELARSIDEYQYALTVEWDQQDDQFYNDQTKMFFNKMEAMIKGGLSQKDIQSLVETRVNNPKAVEALKLKLSLMTKDATTDELVNVVKEATSNMYGRGASWQGHIIAPAVALALVVAVLAYGAWFDANHDCVAYESRYVCDYYSVCTGQIVYGSPYQTTPDCPFFPEARCGYQQACTEYVKK